LTYKDYGLSREEYAPCAKSMVQQLDRMHEALVVLGDADKPKSDRARARQSCFAASSALAQQMREAGGTEKLVSIPWADSTLSRFNYEVEATHKAYLMYCYYGLTGPEVMRMEAGHEMAHSIAKTLP
jgi:hypothetical protein